MNIKTAASPRCRHKRKNKDAQAGKTIPQLNEAPQIHPLYVLLRVIAAEIFGQRALNTPKNRVLKYDKLLG